MNHLMESLDMQTYSLVQAAYKWRQKLQHMKKVSLCGTLRGDFQAKGCMFVLFAAKQMSTQAKINNKSLYSRMVHRPQPSPRSYSSKVTKVYMVDIQEGKIMNSA